VPSATFDGTSPVPTTAPTNVDYTFHDEFDGTKLSSAWGTHWPGFGSSTWSKSQVSVGDGVLTITARRSGSEWVSGLIDTVGTFSQSTGDFSVRMKFTQGSGLWPAFWLAQPQNPAGEVAEIDVAEVCANPPGHHDLNDATLLHSYVHGADGKHAFATGFRTVNLAGQWHVYALDWRPGRMAFYLDGIETSQFTSDPNDPQVPAMPMAVVLDLAVGGRFCGESDASTPAAATLQVDWVRVTR
jgi:beta-glucanase (GH16 family)